MLVMGNGIFFNGNVLFIIMVISVKKSNFKLSNKIIKNGTSLYLFFIGKCKLIFSQRKNCSFKFRKEKKKIKYFNYIFPNITF